MREADFLFDKRVVDWALQSGRLERRDYDNYLKKLKDLADQSVSCEAQMARMRRRLPTRVLAEEEEL